MNYLILFEDVTGRYDKNNIHERVTKHLSATNWWHYLPNVYILATPVNSAGITNSLAYWYPGMLFLVIKIDVNDASGVLPKEAFDWLRNRGRQNIKLKTTPLPKIQISPKPIYLKPTVNQILSNLSGNFPLTMPTTKQTKPFPKLIEDILNSGGYKK